MINYGRLAFLVLLLSCSMALVSCSSNNKDEDANASNGASVADAPSASGTPAYGGAVEYISCDVISGWIQNRNNPAEDIKVNISVDGTQIGIVPANNPRVDLSKTPPNKWGFVMSVPPDLKDGKPHKVSAKVAGGAYDIQIWEKIQPTFTCKAK